MSACKQRISQIYWLLDGELTQGEAEQVKSHLVECPGCAEELERLETTRSAIKSWLETGAALPDDDFIARRAATCKVKERRERFVFRALKKAAIATAAAAAVVVMSAALFVHFYFGKTFSYQLSEIVMRCSDGIERRVPGKNWTPMRVGDPLGVGTLIKTSARSRSFMSFDGIRLLTEGEATFELKGKRALSLQKGEMVIASAERETPVDVALGGVSIRTNGGIIRIESTENDARLGVASGTAELTMFDGTTHSLIENQTAYIGKAASDFDVVPDRVIDPFARMKESAIGRAKKRFRRMLAKYLPEYREAQHVMMRFGGGKSLDMLRQPEEMYRFVSYDPDTSYVLAQANAGALNEYYESLFAPSNRSLSIGRQKLVPLRPGYAPVFPKWSHDGSMLAYIEHLPDMPLTTVVKVVRLDDLENPWEISQGDETVLPMFPLTWAPDNRHVLFMVADHIDVIEKNSGYKVWWRGPYTIKIAPIDPAEGPLRDFNSPFYDIPLPLPIPVGKTISPAIYNLLWGDAMLCGNWGNVAYIPVEEDGQAVPGAPGMFITNFNPHEAFVMGLGLSPSASMLCFSAVTDILDFNPLNVYILFGVDDILDGFTAPPRSLDDPRIMHIAPVDGAQFVGGFSFDESLTFFHEDVNHAFDTKTPTMILGSDFDIFYASTLSDEPGAPVQLHIPSNQLFLQPSPEGNRIVYCNYVGTKGELRLVSFDIETDIDVGLGGVLIDNSGTNLIVPPGARKENFGVRISTPFSMGEEAELIEGEETFFGMRLINVKGLENPEFDEPMTLTIRYTDDEVEGLEERALDIYYYDESDSDNPRWIPLGATVDSDNNEITADILHFSTFAVGGKKPTN